MQRTPTLIMKEFPDFNEPGFDIDQYNQRFYNSNVIIHASANAIVFSRHWGPLSVKCSFNGEENYESGRLRYSVDDEHFLVFNNGKMYSSWIDSRTDVRSLTVNIAPAFEQMAVRSIALSPDQQLDDPFDSKHIDFLFTEKLYRHGSLVSPVVQKIACASGTDLDLLFYQLMEHLIMLQSETTSRINKIDKGKMSTRVEIFERLHRAKDYIHSSYRNNLSLNDISEVACMNPFYFLREFKKAFNITPHQYLLERRMAVASRLLRTTDLPVTEICNDVGFNDLSSFGKLFRRHYGFAPSARRV